MKIEKFTFNAFQENTYVVYDYSKECIVVDPGCVNSQEEQQLFAFIENNDLRPVGIYNTHNHIDHVFGVNAVRNYFQIPFYCHQGEIEGLQKVPAYAPMYGLEVKPIKEPDQTLSDGELIQFGESSLRILLTPGHSPASLCFYHEQSKQLIAGDVLFNGSIGRFDLPGGDYETLMRSIENKLLPLDDDVKVYPGHGPSTTIGEERNNNAFILEWASANK